jgi:hypothetical protein
MARSMPLVTTIARAWPPIFPAASTCSWKWSTMISALSGSRGRGSRRTGAASSCLLGVELRVVLDLLDQLVVAVDGRVVLQHIEDEALLDGLLHGVAVEGRCLTLPSPSGGGFAEHLQRLVLGRGGEGEVAGVGQHLARRHSHERVHRVLGVSSACLRPPPSAASAWLIAAEVLPPWLECASSMTMAKVCPPRSPDLVEDEGELLHRGDDDLLALLDELSQIAGALGVTPRSRPPA